MWKSIGITGGKALWNSVVKSGALEEFLNQLDGTEGLKELIEQLKELQNLQPNVAP